MTYTLDRSNFQTAKTGDKVWVQCFNTGRGVFGTVGYSGPSSTPGCWRVEVFPADRRHPVSPIGRACAVA